MNLSISNQSQLQTSNDLTLLKSLEMKDGVSFCCWACVLVPVDATRPTNSVFRAVHYYETECRSHAGLLESKKKIRGNDAFFRSGD